MAACASADPNISGGSQHVRKPPDGRRHHLRHPGLPHRGVQGCESNHVQGPLEDGPSAMEGRLSQRGTGRQLPVSWERKESTVTWYALTLDYTAAKWPHAAPNHRKSIAEALTDATEAMLASDQPPYPVEEIRRALRTWAFSDRLRGAAEPPKSLAAIARWLRPPALPGADLSRPGTGAARCHALPSRISRKQDGTAAAANTANRKRAVLNNLMQYAVETGVLPANPLKAVKWT